VGDTNCITSCRNGGRPGEEGTGKKESLWGHPSYQSPHVDASMGHRPLSKGGAITGGPDNKYREKGGEARPYSRYRHLCGGLKRLVRGGVGGTEPPLDTCLDAPQRRSRCAWGTNTVPKGVRKTVGRSEAEKPSSSCKGGRKGVTVKKGVPFAVEGVLSLKRKIREVGEQGEKKRGSSSSRSAEADKVAARLLGMAFTQGKTSWREEMKKGGALNLGSPPGGKHGTIGGTNSIERQMLGGR